MKYNKVIKDLKERNDKLQEQYRFRDIRCIHLEYENEMLKSDFEAQHELTKKYAEENQELRIKVSAIEETFLNQQKEFIEYLENEKDRLARECSHIYEDSLGKTRLVNEDIFNEVDKNLAKYKEIIGNDINVGTKGGKDEK